MHWSHKVNAEWLEARRAFLTASDIQRLLPTTPTGRPRADMAGAIRNVWAKKQCGIMDDAIESSGVMARGHILEPYAIEALNKSGLFGPHIHHWDDCLICSLDGIACSPDGLDIKQPASCPVSLTEAEAYTVVEVKCYNPEAHYEVGLSMNPGLLIERWQLATAFYVMPTITRGELVLFNPSAKHPLFKHEYTRADLTDELSIIKDIGQGYFHAAEALDAEAEFLCTQMTKDACPREREIVQEILDSLAVDAGCLNP